MQNKRNLIQLTNDHNESLGLYLVPEEVDIEDLYWEYEENALSIEYDSFDDFLAEVCPNIERVFVEIVNV